MAPDPCQPGALVDFITSTLNNNNLSIVGAVVTLPDGRVFGSFDEGVGLKWIEYIGGISARNGTTVLIWKLPGKADFYDDSGVRAIMRQLSYPGSNPIDEMYALYQYQLVQAGFHPGSAVGTTSIHGSMG
jgi:hypothetical protein